MSTKIQEETTTFIAVAEPQVETSTAATSMAPVGVSYLPPPVLPRLGRLSNHYQCQFCQQTGPTRVYEKIGTCTIVAIVVLLVCFWPLFWLPLVMPSCKDKEHICSHCQRKVRCLVCLLQCFCCLYYNTSLCIRWKTGRRKRSKL